MASMCVRMSQKKLKYLHLMFFSLKDVRCVFASFCWHFQFEFIASNSK